MAQIHPTAVVAPSAALGSDVVIGPYCVVGPCVRLGDRVHLHAHAIVDGDTWIDGDCEVFPFAVIGTTPQDKKLKHDERGGKLRIGKHNRIREHVTIHPGTAFGGGTTTVGDHNMLLVGCHIGHDATVGSHIVFTNGAMAAGHTVVGDRAILGAMAGIHQFARIGQLAMVGAGAMVSHDVPPFSMVQGDRARLVSVNVVGLHRNHFTAEQKTAVKRAFRMLFWRSGTMQHRLQLLEKSALGKEAVCRLIHDFVASSERGVCTPRGSRRSDPADDALDARDEPRRTRHFRSSDTERAAEA